MCGYSLLWGEPFMNTSHPLTPFLKRVRDETWNRFHTGKFEYERDMQNLHNFLKAAQKLGDIGLIIEYHLTISGIEHELGNFEFAQNSYTTLLGLVESMNDHWRHAVILNNLAEIHLWQRDFLSAIATYHQAVEHIQLTDKAAEITIMNSNLGMAYLAQQNYAVADHWFRKTLEIANEDSRLHIDALIPTYVGLADMYVQQKEYEKALTHLKLAKEWALGADFSVDQLEVYFGYAKLARQCPSIMDYQATYYYDLARSALTVPGRQYMVAKVLLDEAGYYQEIQKPIAAQALASEAHKIFAQFGLKAYAKLAQHVLDTLQSPSSGQSGKPFKDEKRLKY
jgi:tetratricopeptide (TPR) repeat protein